MSILIGNACVSAVATGYAHTREGLMVWLEMAPQHPKVVGAIRAELTSNTRRYLQLRDDENGHFKMVYGLGRGYLNLTADSPELAVGQRAKAQLLRMIAPEAVHAENLNQEFYALSWPGIDPAIALAATLERSSPYPMQIGWGSYLLSRALEDYGAESLVTGGLAPAGYAFQQNTPWADIITHGLRQGELTLDGRVIQHRILMPEFVT